MSFSVAAEDYDRFMGRYSAPLAPLLADYAAIEPGKQVLDVGCGPGALVAELVRRLGADAVWAVESTRRSRSSSSTSWPIPSRACASWRG